MEQVCESERAVHYLLGTVDSGSLNITEITTEATR